LGFTEMRLRLGLEGNQQFRTPYSIPSPETSISMKNQTTSLLPLGWSFSGRAGRSKPAFAWLLVTVMAVAVTAADAQVISWSDSNGNTVPATGLAGVVAATNWNNSNPGNGGGMAVLYDGTNNATTAGFSVTGTYGGWGIAAVGGADADGTYNRRLLAGYANTSSGVSGGAEIFSISGIPYSTYNLIAYFSSDTANRPGTITSANAGVTYYFSTIGPASVNGASAVLTQTTDTTGANPTANYAVFTNLTGSSETLTLSIPNGGGLAGFQIVNTGSVTNVLALAADTTVAPAANVYVGATVKFTASFTGTQPWC
jgi:hypothetical protein